MNNSNRTICEKAKIFVQGFFKAYLEDRNFELMISMLHKNISWIGAGVHQFYENYDETVAFLAMERKSWKDKLDIIEDTYQAFSKGDNCGIVFGELKVLKSEVISAISRFSIEYIYEENEFKLYHINFSQPDTPIKDGFPMHKVSSHDYNASAEKKFEEQIHMLKDKTVELETLVNNIYGGVEICNFDEDFTILYANEGFVKLTGYDKSEITHILNEKHISLIVSEDLNRFKKEIFQQIESQEEFSVEYRIKIKDGRIIWVLDKGILIKSNNSCKRVQHILTDITKQKAQEHMLSQKSFELERLTNNIEAAIVRCTLWTGFSVIYASDGFFRMIGYTKEEFKNECENSMKNIIYNKDIRDIRKKINKHVQKGDDFTGVGRLKHRGGTVIWVLLKGVILENRFGDLELQGVLTDITEQKEIEQNLRISEKRYEIAMNLSNITMFEYNLITKELILFENDAKMYGITSITPNGVETFIKSGIIEPNSVGVYREMYEKIHAGVPNARCCVSTKDSAGIIHEFELSLTNVYDDNGKPIRAIGVRTNITKMIQLQKENEFGKTLVFDKNFVCEVDVSRDKIININSEWTKIRNVPDNISFSEVILYLSEKFIEVSFKEKFIQKLSQRNIIDLFEKGEKIFSFEYKMKDFSQEYSWFEATINIIKTQGSIIMRYYTIDISDKKRNEIRKLEEKQLYERVLAKANIIYEVNITKNIFISGHEKWGKIFGIEHTNNYSEMIDELALKAIHPEDVDVFFNCFLRRNVLRAFENGKNQVICDYRRPDENGNFIWVKCTLLIFEDEYTNEIKGHAYIEDINEKKCKELELIFRSEHDNLTGLYNKSAAEKYINDFLSTGEGKVGMHAFFIGDIDRFKDINDNFGHAFGDAVLSKIGVKIKELFRDVDILGRIGGDEFIVFMKNVQSSKSVLLKAKEVCNKMMDSFTINGRVYKISMSIGIAFYNTHGKTYEELYKNSDTALYASKRNGRSQFTVYSENMASIGIGTKKIDFRYMEGMKTFEDNVIEYIFRILHESQNKDAAIVAVLELIGKHYDINHMFIFEDLGHKNYAKKTFEWHSPEYNDKKSYLDDDLYINLKEYKENFDEDGMLYVPKISNANKEVKDIFMSYGIISTLQFSIRERKRFKGFICFAESRFMRDLEENELYDLKSISSVLGIFILEMRAVRELAVTKNIAMSIVNGMNSFTYICDPDTFKILMINDKIKGIATSAKVGEYCYKAIWNLNEPCDVCPMKIMSERNLSHYSIEMNNTHLDVCIKVTSSWIDWFSGGKKCLIDGIDITEYKNK